MKKDLNEESYSDRMTLEEFEKEVLNVRYNIFESIWYAISARYHDLKFTIRNSIYRLKHHFGMDEIWSLDITFYKWLLPRLMELRRVTAGYPNGKTWEGWCEELDDNINKLELIIQFEEDPWLCPDDYVTKDDMIEFRKKYGKVIDSGYLNQRSYENCQESFNKWFGENVNNLWW